MSGLRGHWVEGAAGSACFEPGLLTVVYGLMDFELQQLQAFDLGSVGAQDLARSAGSGSLCV